ncbi:MAG: 50S ribosomal protein L10 [Thaumarchaeota archaeon]|nr:50S ribosomal protein L10 [Candidatus Geocrenenecus arthurdayi]MCL7391235.1 50S ribosomal protein L10 [Candidatus Geocrenenecus arthurdayi]MCL7396598.1 50S ribosomal protein L10 [Candidatus Geocrenenecus arthurdayi]MCL7403533.1 50S ribosomal protein L10 [Candidatus Geocrenenecus arthurdayi]
MLVLHSQAATMRVQKWKINEVNELADLIEKHKVVAVFKLTGLRANLIHEIRKKLRGTAIIRVAKKTLFIKAVEKTGKRELAKLIEDLRTPVGFIFSNISAFKLKILLDKNKILMHAKAGEKADVDVIIPEMNTGLPPGPILSDFGKLKIPTRIEGGQIWIAKDTLVARKGEEISPQLASLLARLDIKAVMKGITIDKAYEDGVLITGESLAIDLEKVKNEIIEAGSSAIRLAVEMGYVTRETIQFILVKAAREARILAVELALPSREVIRDIIMKAEIIATKLKEALELKK